jgi:hypothetical protein
MSNHIYFDQNGEIIVKSQSKKQKKYKILSKKPLKFKRTHLRNILNYRNIHVSDAELKSYNLYELNTLINCYKIKYNNINNKNNSWYNTCYNYVSKVNYSFINVKSHNWYRYRYY